MKEYKPKDIEPKWQSFWSDNKTFQTPKDVTKDNKCYVLPQLPYPSGSGLHVGHAEVYIGCDIFARYQRMKQKKVLQVVGWDSFGLPAENYAIKTNVHPQKSTDDAIDNFRSQIKLLGISADWSSEVGSHNSDYYKWTQWFFLLMYKRGLAYRKKQAVNWCESCKTVLANEQVEAGNCERCGTVILQKEMEQWYLKITQYADRLLEGLDKIDWPEETKKRQKDWIGRSEGANVKFQISNSELQIDVFTTRPDTIFGATYMVLAPEHELVAMLLERSKIKDQETNIVIENVVEVEKYINVTSKKTDLDRQKNQEKTGVELKGIKAINPATGQEIAVWIADYVLASYGFGAIMAVPAHDERDFEFAQAFGLEVKEVVNEDGKIINSDFLNDLSKKEAITKAISWLEEKQIGTKKVQYKLRDWSVSRQRFWGAPIPMLYDQDHNLHPVPVEDLPVILPNDVDFKPTGESPLNYSKSFAQGVEEKYGKGWKREPDTLDTFMCSSWYFFRYLDPKNDNAFASPEALKAWMPVDYYLGGPEHVNGHLLYSRFFTKVLFDEGLIDFDEPFTKHRHQGLILGPDNRKMSKRWGNVVNPTDVINEFGSDTLRTYQMFMGPLEDSKPWDTNGVKGVRRFLDRAWRLQEKLSDDAASQELLINKTIKEVSIDIEKTQYNTAISKLMEFVNAMTKQSVMSKSDYEAFILLLSPFAPHMCEEIWKEVLGKSETIAFANWPTFDESKIVLDTITLAVQVNGKVRATIEVSTDITEEEAKELALSDDKVQKWIDGKEVRKVIYVKGRLISIVV